MTVVRQLAGVYVLLTIKLSINCLEETMESLTRRDKKDLETVQTFKEHVKDKQEEQQGRSNKNTVCGMFSSIKSLHNNCYDVMCVFVWHSSLSPECNVRKGKISTQSCRRQITLTGISFEIISLQMVPTCW